MTEAELRKLIREEVREVVESTIRREMNRIFNATDYERIPTMTISEAARRLGVNRSTVSKDINDGKMKSVMVGGHKKVTLAAFNEYVLESTRVEFLESKVTKKDKDMMTIAELCRATGMLRTQVYRLLEKEKLHIVELNGRKYINYREAKTYMESKEKQ